MSTRAVLNQIHHDLYDVADPRLHEHESIYIERDRSYGDNPDDHPVWIVRYTTARYQESACARSLWLANESTGHAMYFDSPNDAMLSILVWLNQIDQLRAYGGPATVAAPLFLERATVLRSLEELYSDIQEG